MGGGELFQFFRGRVSGPDPVAVEATFSSVATRYDLANHWLSGGIDFYWRNRLVKLAQKNNPTDILDLATGSGDVLFALRKGLEDMVNLTGLDFCEPMLEQARAKERNICWVLMPTNFFMGIAFSFLLMIKALI